MNLKFRVELQLGEAAEIFPQNRCFDFQLVLIAAVLIMASSASGEVWAMRLNTVRGSLQEFIYTSASESLLLFDKRCFHSLVFEHKGDKNSLAAAMLIRRMTVSRKTGRRKSLGRNVLGRKPRQSVAAIN